MIQIKSFVVGLLETNCYLVYSDATKTGFLIDPGLFDKRIADTIARDGVRIAGIINTHGHADHTGGNGAFGYPVCIHEADSDFLKDPIKSLSFFAGSASKQPAPSRSLKHGDSITRDDISFDVIHTPGHTPGSICLKLGKKLFSGDTLFREGVGRTDCPDGSERSLVRSIKDRLMVLDDDTEVLPGHGPHSTIGHERRENPFLQ